VHHFGSLTFKAFVCFAFLIREWKAQKGGLNLPILKHTVKMPNR